MDPYVKKAQQAAEAVAMKVVEGGRWKVNKDTSMSDVLAPGEAGGRKLTSTNMPCSWGGSTCSISNSWVENELANLPPDATATDFSQALEACQRNTDEASCIPGQCFWSATTQSCQPFFWFTSAEARQWVPSDNCGLYDASSNGQDCWFTSVSECSNTEGCVAASTGTPYMGSGGECVLSHCIPDPYYLYQQACGANFDYIAAFVSCISGSSSEKAACMSGLCPSLSSYWSSFYEVFDACSGISTASSCTDKCIWSDLSGTCISNPSVVLNESMSGSCKWKPWLELSASCSQSTSESSCSQKSDCSWNAWAMCQSDYSVVAAWSCEAKLKPYSNVVYSEACDSDDAVAFVNIVAAETVCSGATTEAACSAATSLNAQRCGATTPIAQTTTPIPLESCQGMAGECINTLHSTCGVATVKGLCPGGADTQCCPTCWPPLYAGGSNSIRSRDSFGEGHYGAARGSRLHEGVDIEVPPNSSVLAPMALEVIERRLPYSNDGAEYNDGLLLRGLGDHTDVWIMLWYMTPSSTESGKQFQQGEVIGTSRSLQCQQAPNLDASAWRIPGCGYPCMTDEVHDESWVPDKPCMTNHIHVEIFAADPGRPGSPTPAASLDPTPHFNCSFTGAMPPASLAHQQAAGLNGAMVVVMTLAMLQPLTKC